MNGISRAHSMKKGESGFPPPKQTDEPSGEDPHEGVLRLRKEIADLESLAAHPRQTDFKQDLEPEVLRREEELRALEVRVSAPKEETPKEESSASEQDGEVPAEKIIEPEHLEENSASEAIGEKRPEPSFFADPQFALDPDRVQEILTPSISPRSENTPKEWRDKLRGLIQGAEEKEEGYNEKRSEALDTEAKKLGAIEKSFRLWGEKYNRLGFKSKLAVGLSLGLGAAAFSSVSIPTALALTSGLGVQRIFGMASMFLKFEKHLQDTGEGNAKGFLAKQEWYKKMAEKPEESRKQMAMLMSVFYTVGIGYAIKEGIEYVSNSSAGQDIHEWLGNVLGHHPTDAAPHPHVVMGKITDVPPSQTPTDALHPHIVMGKIVDAPTAVPSVEASAGHGYEYMMKRLWEELQSKHLDPSDYAKGSDIHKLLTADAHSINAVVHQIAADPKHGFFHADGTSVLIEPHAHMSFDSGGALNLSDSTHDLRWAPTHLPTTPAYHPEVSVSAEPSAAIPEVPVISAEPVTVLPEVPHVSVPPPLFSVESAPLQNIPLEHTPLVSAPYEALSFPPIETVVPSESIPVLDVIPPQETVVPIPAEHLAPPVHVEVPVVHSEHIILNKFGVEVSTVEPHIYADDAHHLFVYGGSSAEKMNTIAEYLAKNPKETVFNAADNGAFRIPWHMVDGKILPGEPIRTKGLFGFGASWMKPPVPSEFSKVIK